MQSVGLCGHVGPAKEDRGSTLAYWGTDPPAAPAARLRTLVEDISLPAIRGTSSRAVSARLRAFLAALDEVQTRAEREGLPWASRVGVLRYVLATYVLAGIPLRVAGAGQSATSMGDDYSHEQIAHRRASLSLLRPYGAVNPPSPPTPTLRSGVEERIMREVSAATGVRGNAGIARRARAVSALLLFTANREPDRRVYLIEVARALQYYIVEGQAFDF